MKKLILFLALGVSTMACRDKSDSLEGKWELSGVNEDSWGFALDKEGVASGVELEGTRYQTWERMNDDLLLHGVKTEDGRSVEMTRTFKIVSLENNTLIVEDENGQSLTFTKAAKTALGGVPEEECYAYTMKKDTVYLHVQKAGKKITGDLTYQLYEKDSNRGTIEGRLKGDTLLADYTFQSEGVLSTREVVFLKQGNAWIEGFGPVHEVDKKSVFQDHKQITFTNGIRLNPVNCKP